MPIKTIESLLQGQYKVSGNVVHVPVKAVRIESGLASYAADLIAEIGLKGSVLVVSDPNTHAVLGAKIEKIIAGASLILENGAKANISNVEKIKNAAEAADYIVAVGSGTINDLCKYASYQLNKPYIVFGTAPSMNGYGSANASITVNGHKKTLQAHLPTGIFLDLDILANAPVRLIRSGLGDSVCRSTAQADWLLSHLVLGTFYTDIPFMLLQEWEEGLFANSAGLVNKDIMAIKLLAATLVLSGFGMYIAGGSYPASQGEHMIAHTMDMLYYDIIPFSYHGEQIGITTLSMAKLQEGILGGGGLERLETKFSIPDKLPSGLTAEQAGECQAEYLAKCSLAQEALKNKNIFLGYKDIAEKIRAVTLPYVTIYNTLKNAGCPVTPAAIGWEDVLYSNALSLAKYTRNRFTFLDLR